jgi:hypothetical protein
MSLLSPPCPSKDLSMIFNSRLIASLFPLTNFPVPPPSTTNQRFVFHTEIVQQLPFSLVKMASRHRSIGHAGLRATRSNCFLRWQRTDFSYFCSLYRGPRKVRPLRLGNYNQDVTLFAVFASTNSLPSFVALRRFNQASAPSDSKGQA